MFSPRLAEKLAPYFKEMDEETLSNACDQFRKEVFEIAGKTDPKEKEA